MDKKIILILFVGMFLINFVSSVGEELKYEPGEDMNIVMKCFDTDSKLCSPITNCYIDIFYPNLTSYIYNATMTNNGTFFNYTAPSTDILGFYSSSITCTDGTTSGYTSFTFYVGRPSTESQVKTTNLAIGILMGVFVMFFIGYLFSRKEFFKWTFFILAILFLTIAINVASISLRNEAGSDNIRNIFDKIGAVTYYLYWTCFGILSIFWMFSIILSIGDKWKMKKARSIGQPLDFERM